MATLITDPRAVTDMTELNLSGLTGYKMSVTPWYLTYTDWYGNGVVFTGTGFSASALYGIPNTGTVTGYTLTLGGIAVQRVTGLDLGPGDLEGLMKLGIAGAIPAQERFWRGNDILSGGDFSDVLTGRDGHDHLMGGRGMDRLEGGNGNDLLQGGGDGDNLFGGDGIDILQGGGGGDKLSGDAGNDVLVGGMGRDDMTGGTGIDRFAFLTSRETSSDPFRSDIIRDFEHGIDRIDLSQIDAKALAPGNQAFSFIGTRYFTHHQGELRAYALGGDTHVQGDVNGDGRADFDITLAGVHKLTSNDFML